MRRRLLYGLLLLGLYLGLQNGYIALWKQEATKPVQVFPYRAALYPKADQQALSNGIPITDNWQLQQILEDFLS